MKSDGGAVIWNSAQSLSDLPDLTWPASEVQVGNLTNKEQNEMQKYLLIIQLVHRQYSTNKAVKLHASAPV